jgi:serine protease Do
MIEKNNKNTMKKITKFKIIIVSLAALTLASTGLLLVAVPVQAIGFRFTIGSYNPYAATADEISDQAGSVIEQASPSVVYVNGYKDVQTYVFHYSRRGAALYITRGQAETASRQVSSGSGFFITSDGYILTNKHVVADDNAEYRVSIDGNSEVPAQVVYRDPNNDLAVIKIEGNNYPALQLGNSSDLALGQDVVAIGNALGRLTDFATQGTVTALSRNILVDEGNGSKESLNGVVQINAMLYPGDSGGPLLDLQGQVVAVNTATSLRSRGVVAGFSIPINVAKDVIEEAGIVL